MPVMDGLTATRLIRTHENEVTDSGASTGLDGSSKSRPLRRAKIVALTGLASQEAKNEAFTSGIDMFVTKPVRLAELSKILDNDDEVATKHSGQDASNERVPAPRMTISGAEK